MGIQPLQRITSAATIAASEPSRSPSTWSSCAAQIEILPIATAQQGERDHVDQQTKHGDRQHQAALHRDGRDQTAQRLDGDPTDDRHQGDAVHEGGQNLEAMVTVGAAPILRLAAEAKCDPGQRQRGGVGEHVAGIGEQRQRARDQPADHLGDHEAAGQQHGPEHQLLVGEAGVPWSPWPWWPWSWPMMLPLGFASWPPPVRSLASGGEKR